MLKVYIFCLLSFVFGNSFLLATLTKKTTKPTKEPIVLTDKQTALIKKQMMSTEDPTTLTNEEIQKIRSARAVMYKKIINVLETKPYVEGIDEVCSLLKKPISVSGPEAREMYIIPLVRDVLQWIHNKIKNPLQKDNLSKDERINQAFLINLTLNGLNSEKLIHFFQKYIGPFLVQSGITDDEIKGKVVEKLSELKANMKSDGIEFLLKLCIKDVLLSLEKGKLYDGIFTKTF